MKLSSQALLCFLAVAEQQSYTKAAASLLLSQPGVHQHVRKLEVQLKTRLVEQHGKRVVLTDHGRVVYQFAKRMQEEEGDLIRYLADDVTLGQGQLRLAAGTTAAEFIIPTIAVGFQCLHPGIEVRVRVAGTNDEVDDGIADRSFDLGIHSDGIARPGLDKLPFLSDTLIGICPRDHRLAAIRRAVTPVDLAREPFIHFGPHEVMHTRIAPIQSLVNDWFTEAGVSSLSRLHLGSLEGIKRAVRQGSGVAVVSRYSVDPDDPRIATFRLASGPVRNFYIVSRDHGWESNVVRTFREFAVSLDWAKDDPRGFMPPGTPKTRDGGSASARTV